MCGVAMTLAAQLVAVASALPRRSVPCRPGRAKLIAADTQALVYLGSVVELSSRTRIVTYLGCIRSARRAYELGGPGVSSSSGGAGTRQFALAGSIVAWEKWSNTGMGQPKQKEWVVFVRDLRTGRILNKLPTGTATVKEWTGVGPTSEIVVDSRGDVAWIARVADEEGLHGYEVHVADRSGARTLATGVDIAPKSLAIAGTTLYWTQGGTPASTVL
jgi:hypothetical protein